MLLKDTVNLRTKRAKRNEWYEMKTKKTSHELAKSNTGEEKKNPYNAWFPLLHSEKMAERKDKIRSTHLIILCDPFLN